MKTISYFCLILCLFILSGCGSMKVYTSPNSNYTRSTPITINISNDDESGTLGELQFLLQSNGYKLMSLAAAKKSLNLDSNYDIRNFHSEITNTTTFKSMYVLDVHFTYYYDVFYYAYTNFSATITDLSTGEIILTANFRGDKSVRAVLKELVQKMNSVIK